MTESPRSHSRSSLGALAVRSVLMLALLYLAASMLLTTHDTRPNWLAPPPASAGTGVMHSEELRSTDEVTSATALLARLQASDLGENGIDFRLLRQTVLRRDPPPIFPDRLDAFESREVRIVGFMSPFDSLTDMRSFMLVPNPTGCYFCAPPSPQEVVFIRQPGDQPKPFISEPIEVIGTLRLWREDSPDLAHDIFLFVIDAKSVKPYRPTPQRGS